MTGFIPHQELPDELDCVVFFGADGGCLDAYYLALETHSIRRKIVLSDKTVIIPSGCIIDGGFANVRKYSGAHFVFQCGNVGNHLARHKWYDEAVQCGVNPLTCVSPLAYIHPTAKIGAGSIIYPGVKVMANVNIGENVILLPNVVVNHDCDIGSFSIINSSSVLNGNVQCGRNVYVGSNSTVKEKCYISAYCTVGAGSLVLKDLVEQGLYFGSPAKRRLNAF